MSMVPATDPEETSPAGKRNLSSGRPSLPAEGGVAFVLVCILIYFSLKSSTFQSVENLRLLAKQSTQLALVATGMTLVISTGGIDISVGGLVALCSMTLGWCCVRAGLPVGVACFAAVLLGMACGLVNGLLIARAKLPPIIVTLAMLAAARAGAELFNEGKSFSPIPLSLNDLFDRTQIVGLPLLFCISVLALVVGHFVLRTTTFGRQLLALGGNRATARLAGMPTMRTEIAVYMLSGALAGLAAVVDTASKATATPGAGKYLELYAITAVVLGGTVIAGGQATMIGTALGVVTIGALGSGIRSINLEDQVAWFLVGGALLLAVEVQKWRKR